MSPIARNFIASDTRTLEVSSGVAMFIIGIAFFFQFDMHSLENHALLWGAMCSVVSLIQLAAIAFHPHQMYARIASLWGQGQIWVYFSLNNSSSVFEAIIMMVLGISCFFAFVLNTIIISEYRNKEEVWKP